MARFVPMRSASGFRRMAAAMWPAPRDPSILGLADVDWSAAGAFIERYRALFGVALTPTHLVTRAAGLTLAAHPEANALVGVGRLWLRQSADVFVIVASEEGRNLSGRRFDAVDGLSLAEIASTLRRETEAIRAGQDSLFGKQQAVMAKMPLWLARRLLPMVGFLRNQALAGLGAPSPQRDTYGGAMVSSLGGTGFDTAFGALMPLSHSALMIAVMEIAERPLVVAGEVVARPVLRLTFTADHRVIDGTLGGAAVATLTGLLEAPERLLTEAERARWG